MNYCPRDCILRPIVYAAWLIVYAGEIDRPAEFPCLFEYLLFDHSAVRVVDYLVNNWISNAEQSGIVDEPLPTFESAVWVNYCPHIRIIVMIIPRSVVIASQSLTIALAQNNKNIKSSESPIQKFLNNTNII